MVLERLDLAVLSYHGARMADLQDSFDLRGQRFIEIFGVWDTGGYHPEICFPGNLRLLPLQCRAPFLDHRDVWVFCDELPTTECHYYVSTDIETFADVWGLVWKVRHPRDHDMVVKHNVGGGFIVPWPEDTAPHLPLGVHQRLCHWKSNVDLFSSNDESSMSSSKLLIAQKRE